MNKKELNIFWRKELQQLFDKKTLNYKVKLSNGKSARYINFDNAATTVPFKNVIKGVVRDLEWYGSVHRWSWTKSDISTKKYEEVRTTIKKFVNAKMSDYACFVPNTTVWINQLASFFSLIEWKILIADIEHSSSMLPRMFQEWRMANLQKVSLDDAIKNKTGNLNQNIAKKWASNVIVYKTNEDYSFNIESIENIFKKYNNLDNKKNKEKEKIKVLVVTWASNVTWYMPPINKLSNIAHKYWALIVVDACQFVQHEKIDMKKDDLDFVLFSWHKMYAPFWLWAIVWRKDLLDAFWPYEIWWWNFPYITSQWDVLRYFNEQAHDPWTPNYVWARSLYYAIKDIMSIWHENISRYEHSLVSIAFKEMQEIASVEMYVSEKYLWSVITFNMEWFEPRLVSEILNDDYGIWTRAWSYCVYNFSRRINNISKLQDKEITNLIKKWDLRKIPGSVRASFNIINNIKDVEKFIKAIKEIEKRWPKEYMKFYKQEKSGDRTRSK